MTPPPDYWPDARRIPKEKLRRFVELVRASRAKLGLSNRELCREVRQLIEAHNETAGRRIVVVKVISADWQLDEVAKYELGAILKGTRKYIVGYLGWLCLRSEEAARAFYEEIDLPFRPYTQEPSTTGDETAFASWSALMDAFGDLSRLEVISLDTEYLSLVDLAAREPVARALRLEEPFCFRFDAPIAGDVLAFQRHRGQWYPLPLAEQALHLRIEAGKQILPREPETGEPLPLSESSEAGRYGFAFLVASDERVAALSGQLKAGEPIPDTLAAPTAHILGDLAEEDRAVYRINLSITG